MSLNLLKYHQYLIHFLFSSGELILKRQKCLRLILSTSSIFITFLSNTIYYLHMGCKNLYKILSRNKTYHNNYRNSTNLCFRSLKINLESIISQHKLPQFKICLMFIKRRKLLSNKLNSFNQKHNLFKQKMHKNWQKLIIKKRVKTKNHLKIVISLMSNSKITNKLMTTFIKQSKNYTFRFKIFNCSN